MEWERSGGHPKRRKLKTAAARTAAAAGTAALLWALLAPSGKGIPGWQPVSGALKATLAAQNHDSVAGGDEDSAAAPSVSSSATPTRVPEPSAIAGPALASPQTSQPPSSSSEPASAAALLDLNTATEAELDGLPGVGPSKARAILEYRNAHGGFRSVDELLQVKGIGAKMLERIRPLVRVGAAAGTP
ncbi:ComEA family DNA-binding protein [Cohnella caldifontis]|uniref:ComEA family DNA-binding protein n=1 Tax=Cohnella caldifontis TaxID=3027471 RepID=UPI0023ECE17E|nr:helix-hairpin-helix domain-containing protein [Cohnella sp. YIM B05605]